MLKKVVVILLFNRLMPGVGHPKFFFVVVFNSFVFKSLCIERKEAILIS